MKNANIYSMGLEFRSVLVPEGQGRRHDYYLRGKRPPIQINPMKNANIFVDVDLTLVDANTKLLPGAPESLRRLKNAGCHLFLWSTNGADYCRKIAALHGLTDLFEGFTAKPDIIIDDMPSTCVAPFVYDDQKEPWPVLAEHVIQKHVG